MTHSELVLHTIATGSEEVVHSTDELIEAPNWSPCGTFLIFNGSGNIYRFALSTCDIEQVDTKDYTNCNNDHGISPDGKMLVISDETKENGSCIYTLPIQGGTPSKITENTPSYWHGWSPDGKTLAFTARRNDVFNIFSIDVNGGEETQLTFGSGTSDGPDYTPDGQWIWFNSDHNGKTPDLWRMRNNGSDLCQMTNDKLVNWFPHPSPDGQHILYLAYPEHVLGHPRGQEVSLKLMSPEGGNIRTCASFYGGQGSINVPNWSPDSKRFAYIRYHRK